MATSEPYPTQANLANRLAALESRIEKLERGAPKNQVVFYNSGGDVLMRAGTDPDTEERGFSIGQDSGGKALEVNSPGGGAPQSVKMYDRRGNVIVGDSETYEDGLRRPSISHNVRKIGSTAPAQTTTVYTTVGEAYFRKSNPSIEVVLNYFSSDGATSIRLRFREITTFLNLGTQAGGPYNPTILCPAVSTELVTPPLVLPSSQFPIGGAIHVIVEAEKTVASASTFTVDVLAIRGSDEI